VPTLKFPLFGVFYLFIVPSFIPFVRRFYYTFYDRPEQDLFHVVPDVVLILLAIVYLDRVRKGMAPGVEDRTLSLWVWLFILYQFARVFLGSYMTTMEGLNHFKFTALYTLCFFLAIHFVTSTKQVVSLFKITTVLGLAAALYGIKQVLFGYTDFELIWLKYMKNKFVTMFIEGIPRPFSFLASPACFADLMLFSIITSFSLSSITRGAFRLLCFLGVPVMAYGLLLTSVRTNWMCLLVASCSGSSSPTAPPSGSRR